MKIKVIANYLPQYHRIPENDVWWGDGYTDWVATKKAKPLFKGHQQPRVPLNGNYYDLSDVNTIRWQAQLAKEYGVYGFGIYHYWFNSDLQLLQKPAELLLNNKDIDIHFMFIWDNDSWKRTWSNVSGNNWVVQDRKDIDTKNEPAYLAELIYGTQKDWEKHFNYLLPFFRDERYIKIDGKPMFGFMQPQNDIDTQKLMVEYWDKIAKDDGFAGVYCMSCDRGVTPRDKLKRRKQSDGLEYRFKYTWDCIDFWPAVFNKIKRIFGYSPNNDYPIYHDYEKIWRRILKAANSADKNTLLSGFVSYDDSPRRGIKGTVVKYSTPEKFHRHFTKLLQISKRQGKEYVFCPAWNEWGEGMYLEPDTVNGYGYLEALKDAIDEVNGLK